MSQQPQETAFYAYDQNNSFGKYTVDHKRGIAQVVIVEAYSEEDALDRAESIGLYFDGVSVGLDCSCCGDRWSSPMGPYPEPSVWGGHPVEIDPTEVSPNVYVHYIDGHHVAAKGSLW